MTLCTMQEQYDSLYGPVFMNYFAVGALNITSFNMSTFLHKMLTDTSGIQYYSKLFLNLVIGLVLQYRHFERIWTKTILKFYQMLF
jgi:hypothetical protein